ncbi:unnamed protein product [Polarella glacialis]|uniref:tRNA (guanine(37)-N1)-methyltransferase n=1 Tax=Polarella glacialis TaxID=89957 RepID=A0A813JUL5_POLGL|nr:unnamed protein product [Polarella glacialis]
MPVTSRTRRRLAALAAAGWLVCIWPWPRPNFSLPPIGEGPCGPVAAPELFDQTVFDTSEELWALRLPGDGAHRLKRLPEVKQFCYPARAGVGDARVRNLISVGEDAEGSPGCTLLLLRPGVGVEDLPSELRQVLQQAGGDAVRYVLQLSYCNLLYKEVLNRLLPEDVSVPTSYEVVGHIAHFNLKDEHWPHRHTIGKVFLDKNPNLRTAVAKLGVLAGQFRTFEMEVIAGADDTRVTLREDGIWLEFDFRSVYWNSRLSGERSRVASHVSSSDMLVDLCAGVGGLALMCARKGAHVIANDLNPAAVTAARHNAQLNRLNLEVSQVDARELLERVLLSRHPGLPAGRARVHFVMNLPEIALEMFCQGLAVACRRNSTDSGLGAEPEGIGYCAHCYCFDYSKDEVRVRLLRELGFLPEALVVRDVRGIAPGKSMY